MIDVQFSGCPLFSGTTGHGMMGGGYWTLTGIIFMVLFWVALILAVIWLYKQIRGEAAGAPSGETALGILKKRYASGEITKDEFNEMKKEIE